MKEQQNITQVAQLLGRDKSAISRELRRNAGCRGYQAKQTCELDGKRSESSYKACTLAALSEREQASGDFAAAMEYRIYYRQNDIES